MWFLLSQKWNLMLKGFAPKKNSKKDKSKMCFQPAPDRNKSSPTSKAFRKVFDDFSDFRGFSVVNLRKSWCNLRDKIYACDALFSGGWVQCWECSESEISLTCQCQKNDALGSCFGFVFVRVHRTEAFWRLIDWVQNMISMRYFRFVGLIENLILSIRQIISVSFPWWSRIRFEITSRQSFSNLN